MDKYEIIKKIENFAPLETQEPWDCSGWGVNVSGHNEVLKVILCLTVTDNVIKQAKDKKCDMIISHHPLFYIPFEWHEINIYCAHTNMDLANGGTTDTLIKDLGLIPSYCENFVRYVDLDIELDLFTEKLRKISPNLRYVNNKNVKNIHKIAFCAGSGAEFIEDAYKNGADAFVTGDLKFHTALDSQIVIFDIGHFESEIGILKVFERLVNEGVEIFYADEKSPFRY